MHFWKRLLKSIVFSYYYEESLTSMSGPAAGQSGRQWNIGFMVWRQTTTTGAPTNSEM